jgi:hypothetical protein
MRIHLLPLLSSALAATALAQSETSPKGFLTTEGNGSSPTMLGYYTTAYGYGTSYLQVDATNVGQARALKALSLRRDGALPTNTSYLARTVRIGVRMAHVGWNKVQANIQQHESQVLLTPWATAMLDKNVSLPSLAQQPASPPAAFSILLQLDSNFAYNGSDALAFQILISPSDLGVNSSKYPVDYQSTPPSFAPQAYYGTGCVATGNSQPITHASSLVNYGPNSMTPWNLGTQDAPASVPIVTMFGLVNPNLAFGACEKLFVQPDVTLSGTTTSGGEFELNLTFPHKAEFIGAAVYSQSAAHDAGKAPIPVALSNGMRVTYPADPVQPAVATASQLVLWSNPTWPTQHVFYRGGSMIFGLHD